MKKREIVSEGNSGMVRYGIIRSPYSDKLQARAIELLRLVESGNLKADGLMVALSKEFPRNKRLKNGNLTLKVVRTWAKRRSHLPEIMSGEIKSIMTFDELDERETLHDIARLAINAASFDAINSMFDGKSQQNEDKNPAK